MKRSHVVASTLPAARVMLASDGAFELGGRNVDELCVVATGVGADDAGGCCSAGRGGVAGPMRLGLASLGVVVRRRRRPRAT
jgi:hypothetical protein